VRAALVLLVVLASAGGRHRTKEAPVSLVLSYLHVSGKTGRSATWVLDDRGRQFVLDDKIDGEINREATSGVLSLSAAAAGIQLARPVPVMLERRDVIRARALAARAQKSTARTPHQERACEDGSTNAIFGYLSPSPPASQRAVLLRHVHCEKTVEENLSPAAQELIAWANRLADQANFSH
jgi:hypothetical protein